MASYGKFVTDNTGRGRRSDEQRFLDMHRDVIEEQYDIERAGRDQRRAVRNIWNWWKSLPPMVMAVALCLFVLGVLIAIPFVIIVIARLLSNFGVLRRFIVVASVGALAGTCAFALVFSVRLGII